MIDETTLHTKYRPTQFGDVLGQEVIVRSIQQALKDRSVRAFLFTGPSGVGKTTLARIIAKEVGCDDINRLEIDAATHSGVEAMREVGDLMRLTAIGVSPARVVIVDEAHALSKAAWSALLKHVEEPPANAFWIFCSTEPSKIPKTIQTRCACYVLKPLSQKDLKLIAECVSRQEHKRFDEHTLDRLVRRAEGSARRLLTLLAKCPDNASDAEIRLLSETIEVEESGAFLELARSVINGAGWSKLMELVQKVEEPPEAIRVTMVAYLSKIIMGSKGDKQVTAALEMLDNFVEPYDSASGKAPLLISLGRCYFSTNNV